MNQTDQKLNGLEGILEDLQLCQHRFVYLYPLMNNQSLKKENKKDCLKFRSIGKSFLKILEYLYESKLVISLQEYGGLKDSLTQMLQQFDLIQKRLTSFLEKKRNLYPRLFFLGDENLMEILGNIDNKDILNRVI